MLMLIIVNVHKPKNVRIKLRQARSTRVACASVHATMYFRDLLRSVGACNGVGVGFAGGSVYLHLPLALSAVICG